jgi:transcriptional regulator GlxA family with amidase domain
VVERPLGDVRVIERVRRNHARIAVTASVCTGAFILGKAGLLDGIAATTHCEDLADLRRAQPRITVLDGPPFVDQGRVGASAGIAAGIEMSLHLVARSCGPEPARRTARQMQYAASVAPAALS